MAHGTNQYCKNGVNLFTVEERFLKKIKINEETGCWEWTAQKNKVGYGKFIHDKEQLAHRVSYKLFKGVIHDKLHVCHTCDNPSCVNPEHLWLGTNKENQNDAQNKGRIPTAKHPSSVSYKNGCRCELCRRFLNNTNKLSELKRKGIYSGDKFDQVQKEIELLKSMRI